MNPENYALAAYAFFLFPIRLSSLLILKCRVAYDHTLKVTGNFGRNTYPIEFCTGFCTASYEHHSCCGENVEKILPQVEVIASSDLELLLINTHPHFARGMRHSD